MHPHSEEVVFATSEDGLGLEGLAIRPTGEARHPTIVWVHGLTGRCTGATEVFIGRALAARGHVFVAGNNRGHDFGVVAYRPDGTGVLYGGGWERFDESPRDLAAWIGYAAVLAAQPIVLVGHSLGALKVCYFQAERRDQRVVGLVAASPPRMAYRLKPDLVALAERMVAEGRGRDLLPWGSHPAGGGTFSAEAYISRSRVGLDLYGFETDQPAILRAECPLLAFYGSREEHVGGQSELEAIRRHVPAAETRLLLGADHSYRGHEQEVAELISSWTARLG